MGYHDADQTHPHPSPVVSASLRRSGGTEQCSAKPRLHPLEGEGAIEPASSLHHPIGSRVNHTARGFTLLECLVALAILAVALTAGLRAMGATAQSAAMVRDHTLAIWIAHDRLAELRATDAWPDPGRNDGAALQAGRQYVWRETVERTPNPLFRKVEVQVFDDLTNTPLASATGFIVWPLR